MHSLRLACLAAFGAALSACGGGQAPPAEGRSTPATAGVHDAQSIVISQPSDALSLDPYDENESPTFAILSNIFDPLVDTDPDLQLRPCLAESWTQIDPLTWEFRLRQGVVFHSGDPFAADDVVFSFDRARTWPESEVDADIATIASVEAVDDHTVRITTREPDPILLNRIFAILMMDKESTEASTAEHGDLWTVEHPNGTGPYRFVEWRRDEHIALEAFDQCWRGAPDIKRVRFRPIANDSTRIAALLTGDVDLITDVPVRDTERIVNSPSLQLIQKPSLRLIYLGMDCGRDQTPGVPTSPPNPFKDPRVRRAIYLAIDEEQIVQHVMNGFAIPAGQLVPDAVFGYDPSITRPATNIEEAMRLLTEAGYPNGFTCTLDTPNNRYVNDERIAQALASQLARVQIIVNVNARPKSVFFEDEQQARCSFFLIGWSNSNGDASGSFEYLLHTNSSPLHGGAASASTASSAVTAAQVSGTAASFGTSNNSSQYSNPALDALIQEAARTVDRDARLRLLQQCMQIAMEDLPMIPLHFQVDLFAAVRGLEWRPRRDTRLLVIDMHWNAQAQ